MKYTAKNNILMATIAFMNDSNYENMMKGLPVVIAGVTGTAFKEKQRKAKLGIPDPDLVYPKPVRNLKPEVGMRYPEKRRGRRKANALIQIQNKEGALNG